MVVFGLKLAVEPPGQIAQRLGHDLFGVLGGRLLGRAVAGDVHGHGVFVVMATAVGELLSAQHLAGHGGPMQLKHRLCQIDPDHHFHLFSPHFQSELSTLRLTGCAAV